MAKVKKVEGELSEQDKKMKALFEGLEKEYGKGTIIEAAKNIESYGEVIPFTSIALRKATGIGGIPKNKIVEILGWESSGKSTLCNDIIAQCQEKFGDNCLLLDKENSFDNFYAQQLGVQIEKLKLAYPPSLEAAYDVIEKALESRLFGVIIVDSLTSFRPLANVQGGKGMGSESRINSDRMRMVNEKVRKSNCCVIFINQMREKIGVMFGSPETTSGGNALKFYAHMRIMIRRKEIKPDLETNIMGLQIIKNKMSPPMRKADITIIWGKGFDVEKEAIDMAMEYGILTKHSKDDPNKAGNSWFYGDTYLEASEAKAIQLIKDNPELMAEIMEKVENYIPTVIDTTVDAEFAEMLEASGESVEDLNAENDTENND